MSAMRSTTKLNTDVHETLNQLHERVNALGHHLAWFIDRDNRARLLVTVDAEWQAIRYQAGDETHTVNVPISRRSADIELAPADVRIRGVDGLLRHIEDQLGVPLEREPAVAIPYTEVDRRVA